MKVMSNRKYLKALNASKDAGTLAGFAGMSLIIFGGIAVAGVAKNAGTLVCHRIKDHKAAKAAINEAKEVIKEAEEVDSEE